MSFLQYGIVIWGQTFRSYIEPLFKLQKKAIRTISHQTALSHFLPLFKGLQLLRISDVFKLKLLTFVYDSMAMLALSCFHGYFSLSSTVHNHTTRQSCRNDLIWSAKILFGMVWAQFGTWGPSYRINFLGKLELHLQGLYFKKNYKNTY